MPTPSVSPPPPGSAFRTVILLLTVLLSPGAAAQDLDGLSEAELRERAAAIFDRTCARSGCHAGPVAQMGMDLTPGQFYASAVGQPSAERPELLRVDPGDPENSYLIRKVRGHPDIVGAPMPLGGPPLPEDDVALLEAWVRSIDEASVAPAGAEPAPVAYPFTGWRVVNLPTTRTLDAGSWLFLISHRFNPTLGDGYDAFYGLDGSAIINLSLGYALTDRLLVALARSNAADDVELFGRYGLAHQGTGSGWPVGVSVQGSVNWVTERIGDEERLRGDAFKFTGQASVTRALGGIGVAVVPGILFNPAEREEGEDPLITVGLGARWPFTRRLALVGEWVPIVSGYTRTQTFGNVNRFDSWGGGLEITTGGHVFQIVVANSVGLATDQYLRGGDLDIRDAEMRLGFNIFRILNF